MRKIKDANQRKRAKVAADEIIRVLMCVVKKVILQIIKRAAFTHKSQRPARLSKVVIIRMEDLTIWKKGNLSISLRCLVARVEWGRHLP